MAILAPRITSLSVFVSMLKAAVRKGLSATSCTCARSAVETTRLWSARRLRRQRLTAARTDLRLHVGGYKHCVSFQLGRDRATSVQGYLRKLASTFNCDIGTTLVVGG